MSELAERPANGLYVHKDTFDRQEHEAALQQYNDTIADLPLPMRGADYRDQCRRDIAASTDEPQANAWQDKNGFVFLRLDPRTASVLMYAAQWMASEYEGEARDSFRLSETFPAESYGRERRVETALRRERVAQRLRVAVSACEGVFKKRYHGA